jgi:type II secretory pathway predicted ATPase ExeA
MYKALFNLKRNPFDITPDPSFLFPTKRHNEALAGLYYGVRSHKGFAVLTGEVGTGKTLLLRCLLGLWKKATDVSYAYLLNSRLAPTEFLQYIVSAFGFPVTGKNKSGLLLDIQNYVVTRGMKNLTTVLIVDEAHHLSAETLEEVRLLTNLETTQDKLLQVLLAGQPELNQKLDSVELRQLKQRISIRVHLEPLNAEETGLYIARRLQIAGANSHAQLLFPEQSISAIYRHSRGIPRLINTICENALITAYAKNVHVVNPDIVEGVAEDFRLNVIYKPETETEGPSERQVREAIHTLFDIYSSLKRSQDQTMPEIRGISRLRI